jgi:hypothetical protein
MQDGLGPARHLERQANTETYPDRTSHARDIPRRQAIRQPTQTFSSGAPYSHMTGAALYRRNIVQRHTLSDVSLLEVLDSQDTGFPSLQQQP